MNTIKTIRTEIERRIKLHDALAGRAESEMLVNLEIGAAQALEDLLSFLSTLQEPEKGLDVTEFCQPVDPDIAKSVADHWWEMLGEEKSEKPMNQDELEKEINRYLEPIHTADIQFEPFTQMTKCARHFAKWGADHTSLPEDTVLFNKGVAEGKRLMMEEAVEVKAGMHGEPIEITLDKYVQRAMGIYPGDKVRVIVIPKTDEK